MVHTLLQTTEISQLPLVFRWSMPLLCCRVCLLRSCRQRAPKAGIAGDDAPRAVFFLLVRRPMMLGIMACMNQKDSCSGMYNAGILGVSAPRAVFSWFAGL